MHQKDYKFHYFNTILSSFLSQNTELAIRKLIDLLIKMFCNKYKKEEKY